MGIPPFVQDLRAHVGHAPLWLAGVTVVVLDPQGRVLLIQRGDNLAWTAVTGIIDPGEHPGDAAVREVWEEAGVRATLDRVASVDVSDPIVHANGDHAQYLNITFVAHADAGEPRPDGGETVAAQWFTLDALPPLSAHHADRLASALDPTPTTRFFVAGLPHRPA